VTLLPTPVANDIGRDKTLAWWDEWAPRQKAADGTLAPHGKSLAIEAQRETWGEYARAIQRWENLTRPAPAPTELHKGEPALSPPFVEWMMGLPDGWVSQVDGITRPQALKMLGNGVVPQQAAHALDLLGWYP
jgi:DNA (cytosine-5)-methyltransferase 1